MKRLALVLTLAIGSVAGRASASDALDQAAATELFNVGRDLMRDGDYAAACPKLVESVRLEPTVGALAKLAECEEHERRMVSAYGRWQQALNLARGTNDDRIADVERALARLEAIVPKLRVVATASLPEGASVRVDAIELGPASLGVALPLEAGSHTVTVSAPGRAPWSTTIETAADGATSTVTLPELREAPVVPAPQAARASGAPTTMARGASPSAWHAIGIVASGAGLAAVAAGAAFGLEAIQQRNEAQCQGDVCPSDASANTLRAAQSSATWSTALLLAGGAVALCGAATWWLTRDHVSSAALVVTAAGVAGRF